MHASIALHNVKHGLWGRIAWCCNFPLHRPSRVSHAGDFYLNTSNVMQDMARRGDKAQVLFLGTGCAEPSKYRGSSGIHVRLDSGLGLLLDAGEGAWGGLIRHYRLDQAKAEVGGCAFVGTSKL